MTRLDASVQSAQEWRWIQKRLQRRPSSPWQSDPVGEETADTLQCSAKQHSHGLVRRRSLPQRQPLPTGPKSSFAFSACGPTAEKPAAPSRPQLPAEVKEPPARRCPTDSGRPFVSSAAQAPKPAQPRPQAAPATASSRRQPPDATLQTRAPPPRPDTTPARPQHHHDRHRNRQACVSQPRGC